MSVVGVWDANFLVKGYLKNASRAHLSLGPKCLPSAVSSVYEPGGGGGR